MPSVAPFKSYIVSLFRPKTVASAQPQTVPRASVTIKSPVQPIAVRDQAPRVADSRNNSYDPSDVYQTPEFVNDPVGTTAKSEAAYAAYEAGEELFEHENGFRRKVNFAARNAYARAKSGNFGAPSFASHAEATEWVRHVVASMRSNASTIRSNTQDGAAFAKPAVISEHGAERSAQLRAMHADSVLAAEMDLFVRATVLSKAFDISTALYAHTGGTVTFNATDFSYGGRQIAQLSADGSLTILDEDGRAAGVDLGS